MVWLADWLAESALASSNEPRRREYTHVTRGYNVPGAWWTPIKIYKTRERMCTLSAGESSLRSLSATTTHYSRWTRGRAAFRNVVNSSFVKNFWRSRSRRSKVHDRIEDSISYIYWDRFTTRRRRIFTCTCIFYRRKTKICCHQRNLLRNSLWNPLGIKRNSFNTLHHRSMSPFW